MAMCVGWKVVCGKKSFRPATDLALQRIRYRLGETTRQDPDEQGPFAVFEELSQAVRFQARGYGEKIVLVEYEPSDESALWKKGVPEFTRSKFRGGRGYYAQSTPPIEMDLDSCPNGTALASSVTPLLVVRDAWLESCPERSGLISLPMASEGKFRVEDN